MHVKTGNRTETGGELSRNGTAHTDICENERERRSEISSAGTKKPCSTLSVPLAHSVNPSGFMWRVNPLGDGRDVMERLHPDWGGLEGCAVGGII